MLILSRLRLLQHMGKLGGDRALPPALKSLPAEWRSRYLAIGYQPKYFEANLAEFEAITQSDAQVKAAGNLGDIPLAIIRHGIPSLFESMGPADAANAEALWQELQAQLAALSSQSQLTVADRSGHLIQLEQPSAVVEAVRAMVDRARAAG
jgi:pimeloyl-ACP methyl ester carboxylesterase